MESENTNWFILEFFLPISFLHRFNCGTGMAIIISETKIKLGAWHSVTLYRDGLNGLLQLNNGTPVTGQSQVSVSAHPLIPSGPREKTATKSKALNNSQRLSFHRAHRKALVGSPQLCLPELSNPFHTCLPEGWVHTRYAGMSYPCTLSQRSRNAHMGSKGPVISIRYKGRH